MRCGRPWASLPRPWARPRRFSWQRQAWSWWGRAVSKLRWISIGGPPPHGPPGVRRLKKPVAPDRRISIEDKDLRHGRKSSSKTFNGFKEHLALDLDSKVTREVVVRPANEPEHEAVELLAEELERKPGLLQLDIDLGYMASPRIAQWAQQGVYIIARPWPQVGSFFTKQD